MKTYIPFSGFYESFHNMMLDDAIELNNEDRTPTDPDYIHWDKLNWLKVFTAYATEYTSSLRHFIKEEDGLALAFTFQNLYQPREYNFSTDVVWVDIPESEVLKLYAFVLERGELAAKVKERCTSRSGFSSFYSPDLTDWPESPLDWDAPQLSILFEALPCIADDRDYPLEMLIMDDGNGEITDCIYAGFAEEDAA